MNYCLSKICRNINSIVEQIRLSDNFFQFDENAPRGFEAYQQAINQHISNYPMEIQDRLKEEYFGVGPLKKALSNAQVTEIIINNFDNIWFEVEGVLKSAEDTFLSEQTFHRFLLRLYSEIEQEPSISNPFLDGSWRHNRVHIIGNYISGTKGVRVTIRKHKIDSWSLKDLEDKKWTGSKEIAFLRNCIQSKKNFLVIGPTGSGKTSVLKALLKECQENERIVILEDSMEIEPSNPASTRLLTRSDSREILGTITLTDLVKQSLRMRPDRVVIGEVRGSEAKDLLLALATGHSGSAGTLHAADAVQALIRLEMLIQMGAPQWNLLAIRRLILLSLDLLIVCCRNNKGDRILQGIYKLITVEDSGIIIERVDLS